MRASIEPHAAAADNSLDQTDQVLGDGEVVILKIRPSGWFTLLVSWPVVAGAILIAISVVIAVRLLHLDVPFRLAYVVPAGMVVAVLRFYFGCLQWMKRIYILTNRRMIRIQGFGRTEVFDCPLKAVQSARLVQTAGERILHTGTIVFEIDEMAPGSGTWLHVPRPFDVEQIIQEALRHKPR